MAAKRVYWDSCVWLGLINEEPDKLPRCQHVIQLARAGDVEIWTSALTLAEVFKVTQSGGAPQTIPPESDAKFEDFLDQDFVVIAQVDVDTGRLARRLLRQHGKLKKPPDAIHLATAVLNDLDEFHTFDGTNLLPLNGEVNRADGVVLAILWPPEPSQGLLDLQLPPEKAAPADEDAAVEDEGVEAPHHDGAEAPGANGVGAEMVDVPEVQIPAQPHAPGQAAGGQAEALPGA